MAKICGFTSTDKSSSKNLQKMIKAWSYLRGYKKKEILHKKFSLGILDWGDSYFVDNNDYSVFFSGYLLDQKTGENFAKICLNLYKREGDKFAIKLNGIFNLIIYNKHNFDLLVINDRYGVIPFYYYKDDKGIIFASEVKAIINNPEVVKEINWDAWGDYFSFRYILGEKTYFKNIFSLPNATVLKFKNNKLSILKYWKYENIKIIKRSKDEIISLGSELVKKSIISTSKEVISPICFLSGGYDSRCLASSLSKYTDLKYTTYTTEHPTGKSDPIIAKKVAKKLKVENIYIKHPNNFYQKYFVDKIRLLDGVASEGIWSLPLSFSLKKTNTIFDGLAGDLFLKGLFLDNSNYKSINNNNKLLSTVYDQIGYSTIYVMKFFNKEVRTLISNGRNSLKRELDKVPSHENKISIYFAQNRTRNALSLMQNNVFSNQLKRFPFLDNDLVDFSLSIPPELKVKEHVYLEILKKSFPQEMNIPTTNDTTAFKVVDKIFGDLLVKLRLQRLLKSYLKNLYFKKYFNFKQSDVEYIKSLISKLTVPEYINTALLKKYQNNEKFDFAYFSLVEHLVWYNFFYLNKIKTVGKTLI